MLGPLGSQSPEDRSAIAKAIAWANEIIGVALMMVLPAALGIWLDRYLGTVVVLTVLGIVVGMYAAITHLLRVTQRWQEQQKKQRDRSDNNSGS